MAPVLRVSLVLNEFVHIVNLLQVVSTAAGAVAGIVLAPIVAPIAVGLLGFGATGVAAGKFPSPLTSARGSI